MPPRNRRRLLTYEADDRSDRISVHTAHDDDEKKGERKRNYMAMAAPAAGPMGVIPADRDSAAAPRRRNFGRKPAAGKANFADIKAAAKYAAAIRAKRAAEPAEPPRLTPEERQQRIEQGTRNRAVRERIREERRARLAVSGGPSGPALPTDVVRIPMDPTFLASWTALHPELPLPNFTWGRAAAAPALQAGPRSDASMSVHTVDEDDMDNTPQRRVRPRHEGPADLEGGPPQPGPTDPPPYWVDPHGRVHIRGGGRKARK